MELRAFVMQSLSTFASAFLTSAKSAEILGRFRNNILEELNPEITQHLKVPTSITMRPTGLPPIAISKNTRGFAIVQNLFTLCSCNFFKL